MLRYNEGRERIMKCDHVCIDCGKHETGNWMDSCSTKLAERKLCFTCDHWTDLLAMKDDPRSVRVKGVHYRIAPPARPGAFEGFGGARFDIQFNDGRKATTNNLWCQGHIAENFKERLPDNACFAPNGGASGG